MEHLTSSTTWFSWEERSGMEITNFCFFKLISLFLIGGRGLVSSPDNDITQQTIDKSDHSEIKTKFSKKKSP